MVLASIASMPRLAMLGAKLAKPQPSSLKRIRVLDLALKHTHAHTHSLLRLAAKPKGQAKAKPLIQFSRYAHQCLWMLLPEHLFAQLHCRSMHNLCLRVLSLNAQRTGKVAHAR